MARLKVRVEDTGIGIPAEKLQTVFEKFAQVDGSSTRRHEGTGLGLAIAARLVDLMGGKIGIESEVGRGSIFWFTVAMPIHSTGAAEQDVPVDVTGARVLVVDDNAGQPRHPARAAAQLGIRLRGCGERRDRPRLPRAIRPDRRPRRLRHSRLPDARA